MIAIPLNPEPKKPQSQSCEARGRSSGGGQPRPACGATRPNDMAPPPHAGDPPHATRHPPPPRASVLALFFSLSLSLPPQPRQCSTQLGGDDERLIPGAGPGRSARDGPDAEDPPESVLQQSQGCAVQARRVRRSVLLHTRRRPTLAIRLPRSGLAAGRRLSGRSRLPRPTANLRQEQIHTERRVLVV